MGWIFRSGQENTAERCWSSREDFEAARAEKTPKQMMCKAMRMKSNLQSFELVPLRTNLWCPHHGVARAPLHQGMSSHKFPALKRFNLGEICSGRLTVRKSQSKRDVKADLAR